MIPKRPPVRDRKWLDHLRTERCIITGRHAQPNDAVDPCHVGTAGKGIKSGDDEALPILHSVHVQCHGDGEISTLRQCLPDDVLRAALRAYARERYAAYKDGLTGNKE